MKLEIIGFDFRLKGRYLISADTDLFPRDEEANHAVLAQAYAYENPYELLSLAEHHNVAPLKQLKIGGSRLIGICLVREDLSRLESHTGYSVSSIAAPEDISLIGYDICDMNGLFSCLPISEVSDKLPEPESSHISTSRERLEECKNIADNLVPEHAPHFITYIIEL